MRVHRNDRRGPGLPGLSDDAALLPGADASRVASLLARCPAAEPTPLLEAPAVARRAGVAALHLKDERGRMGLGSFKALGAAFAIAVDAAEASAAPGPETLAGRTYVAASAGNHGLSLAAGARVFGATAVIFLAESVPEAFAERLRAQGARVQRAGAIYEESMAAAMRAAETNGWTLLSDSSWPGYLDAPRRVMEGYLQMAAEAFGQMESPPTHVLLQAGVGGMAAAVAAFVRAHLGEEPCLVVVEPEAAPALFESVRQGGIVETAGPVSVMGRLDCKVPSLIALAGLARDADLFALVSEEDAEAAVEALAGLGIGTTPSGAAGVAALIAAAETPERLALEPDARVLAFLTEGPEG